MRFAEVSPINAVRSIRYSVEVMGDALCRSVAYNVQNVFKVLMLFKEYFTILGLSDMFWELGGMLIVWVTNLKGTTSKIANKIHQGALLLWLYITLLYYIHVSFMYRHISTGRYPVLPLQYGLIVRSHRPNSDYQIGPLQWLIHDRGGTVLSDSIV